jgi:N-acyl-D-aspartate/D-glutamate deacylase
MGDASTLVIRGGTVADGGGGEPCEADIAVVGGVIAEVGKIARRGDREIDARGLLVTPGFVDVHTHYDAQATWSSRLSSSSWHGVTTALIGNCGVGFAPCTPERRDMLVKLMEGVEDLPEVVLSEGLPWTWESFPDFLDVLDARSYDMDVVAQVPHAALRIHVMGQRAADLERANEADRAAMVRLAAEGIRAGALGFSTSRALAHKTLDGRHTPTLRAAEEELVAIARAVGEAGSGWLQVISDFDDPGEEFAMLRRVAAASGRPMTFSLLQRESVPWLWRFLLDRIEEANRAGVPITGQVMARPIGLMLGFELSQNPFSGRPSYGGIAGLPFERRLEALRRPDFRARLLSEATADPGLAHRLNAWDRLFPLGDPPEYEPAPDTSIAAEAARRGVDPQELAYDVLLARDGKAILNRPIINYADSDLEAVRAMVEHPHTLMGLGDGGAHVGLICDASATTSMITHWTRDRTRGPRLPLGFVVKRLSRDNAVALGLEDRGLIAPGCKADINVIDYDRLRVRTPEVLYDLPAGGKRMVQRADGYVATLVSGVPVYREGEATGALSGRLVRGARPDARQLRAAQ